MSHHVQVAAFENLYAASFNGIPTFENYPASAVTVCDPALLTVDELSEILSRYTIHGFAVLQLPDGAVTAESTEVLAASLGLGPAFVPPLYTVGGRAAAKVSRISAAANKTTIDSSHPSFGATVGQALHTDGTLQDIGYVKASVLACKSPAAEGGSTMLFNCSAAYRELLKIDPEAAIALGSTGCLVRQANINGSNEFNDGPAFAVDSAGELITRYSVTDTDTWNVPDGVAPEALWRGVAFLDRRARLGRPEYVELDLKSDQVIVFANSRISHGRRPYQDSAVTQRCLYRSLHLKHPSGPAVVRPTYRWSSAGQVI